jgi:peptidoglycan/xylan/chitin deacetylase (PgdA/CDA1 family)
VNKLKYGAKAVIHGSLNLSGAPRRKRESLRGHLVVLTYHSFCLAWPRGLFGSLPVHQFERQLRFLRDRFEVVSLEKGLELISAGSVRDKPFLALTIDDGFEDNYTLAWPLLKEYEFPATIFLATDFIDSGRPPWPTQVGEILERTSLREMSFPFSASLGNMAEKSDASRKLTRHLATLAPSERFLRLDALRAHLRVPAGTKYRALDWGQVREMQRHGMRFGSHTVFHSYLPSSSDEVVKQELCSSKQRIEEELRHPCRLFAFPDGAYDASVVESVSLAGFDAAVTQVKGSNVGTTNQYALHRVEVPYHDPLASFKCRSSLAL